MRFLIVSKRPPTRGLVGGDGDANVLCAAVDEMHRRGHTATIVSFSDEHSGQPDDWGPDVEHVILPSRDRRQAFLRYPLHRTAVSAWQRQTNAGIDTVRRLQTTADVLYLHGISTFGLALDATIPVVCHEIDPMSLSQREEAELDSTSTLRGVALRQAAGDYRKLEVLAAACAAEYLVVTERDAQDLSTVLGRPVTAVGLGYQPNSATLPVPLPDRPIDVAFVGALNFAPNRHALATFLDDVVVPLRQARPRLRAVVAGRRADRAIAEQCRGVAELVSDPPDLAQLMGTSKVCVFTNTFGRGERTTVREALASATPVVGTPWSLRNVPTGPHAQAGDADEIREAITLLLDDPNHWAAASVSAETVTSQMPSWKDVSACLVDLLENAVTSATSTSAPIRR